MTAKDVVLKYVAPIRVAELTATAASYSPLDVRPAIEPLHPELLRRLAVAGVQRSCGPAMAFYENPKEPSDTVVVHAAFPVLADPHPSFDFEVVDLPAIPVAATIIHTRAADDIMQTLSDLAGWMEDNGYRPGPGLHREIYLAHRPCGPAAGAIELQVSVADIEPEGARPLACARHARLAGDAVDAVSGHRGQGDHPDRPAHSSARDSAALIHGILSSL